MIDFRSSDSSQAFQEGRERKDELTQVVHPKFTGNEELLVEPLHTAFINVEIIG